MSEIVELITLLKTSHFFQRDLLKKALSKCLNQVKDSCQANHQLTNKTTWKWLVKRTFNLILVVNLIKVALRI